MKKKINVTILGTGNIGTDLLLKTFSEDQSRVKNIRTNIFLY